MVNCFFRSLNKIVCLFLSPAQMEINYRSILNPRRDNPTVLLVVVTGIALAVAIQGEQYSTIRETPLRPC